VWLAQNWKMDGGILRLATALATTDERVLFFVYRIGMRPARLKVATD